MQVLSLMVNNLSCKFKVLNRADKEFGRWTLMAHNITAFIFLFTLETNPVSEGPAFWIDCKIQY